MGGIPASYLPARVQPWRMSMGLRPLDPAGWLEVDSRRGVELARKHELLVSDHAQVFASVDGASEAAGDLLVSVLGHLERHHPGVTRSRGASLVEECTTGAVIDVAALHPVDAAARFVQEDLCLMELRGGAWVLTAASVCFPSRWSLAAKVGRDLGAIHGPVPGYEAALGGPVETFFDRLRPQRPMWRLNWTLLDSDEMHLPDPTSRRGVVVSDPGEQLWVRVERQTLRRLDDRPAIVFTIRTYVERLGRVVAEVPGVGAALRAAVATAPPEIVAYKGWGDVVGALVDWLGPPP